MNERRTAPRARLVILLIAMSMLAWACGSSGSSGSAGKTTTPKAENKNPAGMGTAEALNQTGCDKTTKRTTFYYVNGGPFCVKPFPAGTDNGGATYPGVTATEVKVIVYVPNDQMKSQATAAGSAISVTNRVTGQPGKVEEMVRDYQAVYDYANKTYGTYQTWGRKPVYEFVEASGADEAAQRADAVTVIAKKPFIVLDGSNLNTGAPYFAAALANAKIIVQGILDANASKQAPYRWGSQSPTAAPYLIAGFLGNSLSGEKAKWAGDALKANTRKFGIVRPASGFDDATFTKLLKDNGSTPMAVSLQADSTDAAKAQETAGVMITKLKSAGVTTVVLYIEPAIVGPIMKAATQQQYEPEWIYTGRGFQDFDGYGRNNDAAQMKHAFGLGILPPSAIGGTPLSPFNWYWPMNQGVFGTAGNLWSAFVNTAIHYAGPNLTPETVRDGFFKVPAVGGAKDGTVSFQTGYGRATGLPYDEYSGLGTDRNLLWWNPDISGGTNAVATIIGKGKFEYLFGGKRFAYKDFPTTEPKFFDPTASVFEVPQSFYFAGHVQAKVNPCTGCPSEVKP